MEACEIYKSAIKASGSFNDDLPHCRASSETPDHHIQK